MSTRSRFDALVAPHLDAGYNLARWLLRDERSAEDALQEASLRAFRHLDSLQGDAVKPWFLAIVRNCCFTLRAQQRSVAERDVDFDEIAYAEALRAPPESAPEARAQQRSLRRRLDAAIAALSPPLREVLVLREMEGLDYAAIAQVAGIPTGTVMSRLARARDRLRTTLAADRIGDEP